MEIQKIMEKTDDLKARNVMRETIGHIIGKTTTTRFEFLLEENIQKLDYVQVPHHDYGDVLCQIIEIEHTKDKKTAKCIIIGYIKNNKISSLKFPFTPGEAVYKAKDELIKMIIKLETPVKSKSAYIGHLEGKDIEVFLDLNRMLSRHVSVLAKSGSGKSYCVGVLIEEILQKKVPLIIIDPHGEYSSLRFPNDNTEEIALMKNIEEKLGNFESRLDGFEAKLDKIRQAMDMTISAVEGLADEKKN